MKKIGIILVELMLICFVGCSKQTRESDFETEIRQECVQVTEDEEMEQDSETELQAESEREQECVSETEAEKEETKDEIIPSGSAVAEVIEVIVESTLEIQPSQSEEQSKQTAEITNSEPLPSVSLKQEEIPSSESCDPVKEYYAQIRREFESISEEQIRAWFLEGFNAKRAEFGLGPVPEDPIVNGYAQEHAERCAASRVDHSTSIAYADLNIPYWHIIQYESIGTIGKCEQFEPIEMITSGTEDFRENAIWFGGTGGFAHCPNLYTEKTKAMGIGVARQDCMEAFIIVVQGYDYE